MYPRNSASPPTIDLGQMVNLTDGSIQTSGASVRVKTESGSWGAGAGSLNCDATSGLWTYSPTQAETNDTAFIVVAYKSDCSAPSKTVITSASATAGYAGLDWSKINAPTTTVGLSGTTIKTATDVEADTVDIQSRIPLTLDNGNMRSSVQNTTAIADAVWAKDISGATAGTAGGYLKDIWGRITAAVYTMWTNLIAMITGTGASASFTAKAMENATGASVAVYPTQLQAEDRNVEGPIKIYTGEYGEQYFHALDANLDPIDLTGITLELRFGDSIQKNILYTAKTSDNTIVVSNQNKVTFTKSLNFTRFEMSTLRYSLRDMDEGAKVLLTGPVKLSWAP